MLHKNMLPASNHVIQSYEVTTLADVAALSLVATDRGRVVLALDTLDYYVITAVSPNATKILTLASASGESDLFVGAEAPADPAVHPFWLKSDTNNLYVYKGGGDGYINVSAIALATLTSVDVTPPADPQATPIWVNFTTGAISIYAGLSWHEINAAVVPYNNAVSGLLAENTQDAIDEIVTVLGDIQTILESI